jgi:hypothetical protein
VSATLSSFPTLQYNSVLALNNDKLAQRFFNMTVLQAFTAIRNNQLSLNNVSQTLKDRVLSLNVFYANLDYTLFDQEAAYELAV